jgi:hypothetical protein
VAYVGAGGITFTAALGAGVGAGVGIGCGTAAIMAGLAGVGGADGFVVGRLRTGEPGG